jgi:hypothetical protein
MSESVDLIWTASDDVSPTLDSINNALDDMQSRLQFKNAFEGVAKGAHDLAQGVSSLIAFNDRAEATAQRLELRQRQMNLLLGQQNKRLDDAKINLQLQAAVLKKAYSPSQLQQFEKAQVRVQQQQERMNVLLERQSMLQAEMPTKLGKIGMAFNKMSMQLAAIQSVAQSSFSIGNSFGRWLFGYDDAMKMAREEAERAAKTQAKFMALEEKNVNLIKLRLELANTEAERKTQIVELEKKQLQFATQAERNARAAREYELDSVKGTEMQYDQWKQRAAENTELANVYKKQLELINQQKSEGAKLAEQVMQKKEMQAFIVKLQQQLNKLGKDEWEVKRAQLAAMKDQDGGRRKQAEQLLADLERQSNKIERQKQLEEMRAAAIERQREVRREERREAEQMEANSLTTIEKHMQTVMKINELRRKGLISEETARRQLQKSRAGAMGEVSTVQARDDRFSTGRGSQLISQSYQVQQKILDAAEKQAAAAEGVKASIDTGFASVITFFQQLQTL